MSIAQVDYECVACGSVTSLPPSGGLVPACCPERHDLTVTSVAVNGTRKDLGLATRFFGATA